MYGKSNIWGRPSLKSPRGEGHRTLRYECILESCNSSIQRDHQLDEDQRGLPIPHPYVSSYLCIETGPPFSVYASQRSQESFTSDLKKSFPVIHYDLPERNVFSYGYQGPISYHNKGSLSDCRSYPQDEKKTLRVKTGQRPDVTPGTDRFLGREKLSDIKLKSQAGDICGNERGKNTSSLLRETPADVVELMIKYKNWSFRQSLKDKPQKTEKGDGNNDITTNNQKRFADNDFSLSYETDERSNQQKYEKNDSFLSNESDGESDGCRNTPNEPHKHIREDFIDSTNDVQNNSNSAVQFQNKSPHDNVVTLSQKCPDSKDFYKDSSADFDTTASPPADFDRDTSTTRKEHQESKNNDVDDIGKNVLQNHYTISGLQTEDIIIEAQEGFLLWTQPDGKLMTIFRNGSARENFSLFINPSGCEVRILQLAPSGGHKIILDGKERTKAKRARKYCRNRTNKNLKNHIELQPQDGEVKISIQVLKDKKTREDFRLEYEIMNEESNCC